ncbi:YhgE/Pip family protein [Caldalkalibacillus mannanilyticus]|uniref:YhgE/Pip family protein n=1 Tax=Caldalkalibacillus mannanilyticus TaxID=1418 RepID=UPI00131F3178|nr:YhgE/Pip family protein [Caldalkalibacillus mannanilyticus]
MFASPIEIKHEKRADVPNYGTGFAPYFLSLGLFVGALLLSIVFPLREPAVKPASALHWFIGKFVTIALIGTGQALIACVALLYGLGIEVVNVPYFFLFAVITSITFMALIQFLVTTLGDPGRFIAIVILILQLTTSAGTFPLELLPSSLQVFNHWLPMTYSVFGFKEVISGGDLAFMWSNVAVLSIYIGMMMIGTYLFFRLQHKKELPVLN